ncbi:hypothetical protein GF371_00660 [Candidatus Woesearchaeota archaeon]|nr:hypothetical protein [Candidatus Woesearchaeota archaeon]
MELKTLTRHMEDIKQRQVEKESNLELNIFAEEIERAKTATFDTVRDELPETIIEPYGKVEFFPEFENPSGYDQWLEMRKEGFIHQPMQEVAHVPIYRWSISRPIESGPWHVTESFIELPYKNSFFGKTFRINPVKYTDEMHELKWLLRMHINIPVSAHVLKWVFGITKQDLELDSRLLGSCWPKFFEDEGWVELKDKQQYFAYFVGIANDLAREPTKQELEKSAVQPMVERVFGMKPPTEEEIKKELLKIHSLPETAPFHIRWVKPEELDYPMPRGVFYTYKDAKESGIFEKLEFGMLEEDRRIVDPVLTGTYKGFRIPLCYWA